VRYVPLFSFCHEPSTNKVPRSQSEPSLKTAASYLDAPAARQAKDSVQARTGAILATTGLICAKILAREDAALLMDLLILITETGRYVRLRKE